MAMPMTLPPSTHAPLRGGPTLRWGVIGAGDIAGAFIRTTHANTDQRAVAVGSRVLERAEKFANDNRIERAYGSYEQLVADPDVDIVYIASPHSEHREHALLAIAAGKHVLVEKPIALSAAEASDIAAAARAAGVFVMEAMWTRFQPKTSVIRTLLDDGVLGDLDSVIADFGYLARYDMTSRLFDPALGGGMLLDIGVYAVWFSQFVLGVPSDVHAHGQLAVTGVDERASVVLDHDSGASALLYGTFLANTPNDGLIIGNQARISVPAFVGPGNFVLTGADGTSLEFVDEVGLRWHDGLCFQTTAVAQHIAEGLIEAPEHPMSTTIQQLETIDAARTAVGYPPAR